MAMTLGVAHSLHPLHPSSPASSTVIRRPCSRPASVQCCSCPPPTSKRNVNSSLSMLPSSSFNPLRRGPHHRYEAVLKPRATVEGGEGEGADSSQYHGVESGIEPFDWIPTFIAFLFPALGGALFGYDIGATSGALISLTSPELSGTDWYRLTAVETGLVVSGSLYGALIGSILAFKVSDAFGRRKELIAAACLYIVGAVTMLSAPSLTVLLIGRLIYGLGIGLAMHGAPLYIAETCPPQIRGTLVSLKEAFIVLGILVGYLVGNLEIGEVGGWRAMYGFAAPVGLAMAAGMWWLPPSPRWLLLHLGKSNLQEAKERAVSALLRLRKGRLTSEAAESVIRNSLISLQSSEAEAKEPTFSEVFQGSSLKALKIGAGLVFFQQITGQPSVLYYAASILQSAGFSAAADATRVSIIIGIFKIQLGAVEAGELMRGFYFVKHTND